MVSLNGKQTSVLQNGVISFAIQWLGPAPVLRTFRLNNVKRENLDWFGFSLHLDCTDTEIGKVCVMRPDSLVFL